MLSDARPSLRRREAYEKKDSSYEEKDEIRDVKLVDDALLIRNERRLRAEANRATEEDLKSTIVISTN